jgi:hypothetical protein
MFVTQIHKTHTMKFLKRILASFAVGAFLFSTSTQFSACTKDVIHDTVFKKDTIRIIDSVCYDLTDSLIAWYKFTGGSLKDSSGKNNHIVFNNATASTDRFGVSNNAYSFNGTSNFMTANNSSSLNPKIISMMAIIKVNNFYTGLCRANNILSKGYNDYASGFYAFRFINPGPDCSSPLDVTKEYFDGAFGDNTPYGAATGARADTVAIKTNRWYNVIYTYDGIDSKIYIDGALKSTYRKSVNANGNAEPLFIGKHADVLYPYYFNGTIDEIRLYNKALCDGEIRALNKLKN